MHGQLAKISEDKHGGARRLTGRRWAMPKYKVVLNCGDEAVEEEDEVFNSSDSADGHGQHAASCCYEGAEMLRLSPDHGEYHRGLVVLSASLLLRLVQNASCIYHY